MTTRTHIPLLAIALLIAGCEANGPRIQNVHPLGAQALGEIAPECAHPSSADYVACKKSVEMLEADPVGATDLFMDNWDHVAFGARIERRDRPQAQADFQLDVDGNIPSPNFHHDHHHISWGGGGGGGGGHWGSGHGGGGGGHGGGGGGGHLGGLGGLSGGGKDCGPLIAVVVVVVAVVIVVVAVVAVDHEVVRLHDETTERRIASAQSITTRTLAHIYQRSGDPYSARMSRALTRINYRDLNSLKWFDQVNEATIHDLETRYPVPAPSAVQAQPL